LFEERIPKLAENIPGIVKEAKRQASVMALAERLGVVAKLDAQSGAISKALGMHFWVTGVDKKTTISLKNLIADALRGVTPSDKVSLPDFIDHDWLEKSQDLTAARLETIYRTNLQTAYNEGHMASLRAPEVKHVAPLVMIVEIQDPRSRPHHAAMDGYINTVEVIDRLQIRPPNGFNCRGTVRAISWTEADSLGLMKDGEIDQASLDRYNGKRQGYIDRGEYPDPGFDKVTRAA
jgi:SPP1 gp7 family putative phage head morphogenesis protein